MNIDKQLVVTLLEASLAADYTQVRRIGGEIARLLADEGSAEEAKRVAALMRKRGVPLQASGVVESLPVDANTRLPLVEEQAWPVTPVFTGEEAQVVTQRFLEDARNSKLLHERGLAPRLSLMLSGVPGTGKSLLAGHIAAQLGKPFYVARLDSVISSRLGETAKNIRGIFDYVPARGAVLFLDEMDAVAKLRDDKYELGELKRVVNTVIQGLDSLDSDSVVIGATNHPHLLDPAIWRRFPYKIELGLPDYAVRAAMWRYFLYEDQSGFETEISIFSELSDKLSGADIENLALTMRRRAVLSGNGIDPVVLAWAIHNAHSGRFSMPASGLTAKQRGELGRRLMSLSRIPKTELAKFLGVSRPTLYRYERGEEDG